MLICIPIVWKCIPLSHLITGSTVMEAWSDLMLSLVILSKLRKTEAKD